MDVFRAAMMVAVIVFGAIAALLGFVVLVVGLPAGSLTLSFVSGAMETVTRAGDPERFWRLMLALGAAPLLIGAGMVKFGMRRIRG